MKKSFRNAICILLAIAAMGIFVYSHIRLTNNAKKFYAYNTQVLLQQATPIVGVPFDFCTADENTSPARLSNTDSSLAEEVVLNTPVQNQQQEKQYDSKIVGMYWPWHYHILLVGVGYEKSNNIDALKNAVKEIAPSFKGINVDFAYAEEPVMMKLNHIRQLVLVDQNELNRFDELIKSHNIDGVYFLINSDEYLGTASGGLFKTKYTFSNGGNNQWLAIIMTHEIGHMLGLSDGYKAYSPEEYLPNGELFFADSMPVYLANAVKKLGYVPPLFEAGICKDKTLYRFYESDQDIMGDYNFENYKEGKIFTPLQKIIMNNYVHLN